MICDDYEGYYFDRLKINIKVDVKTTKKMLLECGFVGQYRELNVIPPEKTLGYGAVIDVVAPNSAFLKLLRDKGTLFGKKPLLTYCEIAHDVFSASEYQAKLEADKIFRTIRMKYFYAFIYDEEKAEKKKSRIERIEDYKLKGMFADRTFYSVYEDNEKGSKTFRIKHTIYARLSKINWHPCVHSEWRLIGVANIKKLTGINDLQDLASFDFRVFFEQMERKYILHEELDGAKIGKILSGMERRKVLSNRQRMKGGLRYAMFRSFHNIETASDFANAVRMELKRSSTRRGPKSPWTKKMEKLLSLSKVCKRRCL